MAMTRYYIAHPDANVPAVYLVDGEYLAHAIPDWEQIEASFTRVWSTTNKNEAHNVAQRYRHFGTRVVPYRVNA